MVNSGRREEFLQTTMKLVAQKGLGGFSMKQVTDKMGVSEALIYKYFESKDNLLYACFESFHMRVAALFGNFKLPELINAQSYYAAVRGLWFTYFDFLVKGDYKTIFYFDYRDSSYMKEVESHDAEVRNTYFKDFAALMHEMNSRIHFSEKVSEDVLWTYVLDTSGIFAKRIIRKEIADGENCREEILKLIFGGISSVLF